MDFVVVDTHPDMIKYIDHLQRKNAEALSFYPQSVFEREHAKGRLLIGLLNSQPCGYIYHGSGLPNMTCHQVCIEYEARRRLYGAAIVKVMEDRAQQIGSLKIVLRCGFDLLANDFWKSLGYVCVDVQQGGVRRNRKINVWCKYLVADLFSDLEVDPAQGKTSSKMWQKNKQTGLISGFNRGKTLIQYRSMIDKDNE